jgi:CheY-like chemotaxis protein
MKTVLFIDDDQFVTTLYRAKLQGEGYHVEIAHSGQEALEKLKTLRPHTIILDLNMPEMNGAETLKQIRANPQLKDIPVIVFSNGYVQQLIDEVCPLGVQKFFTKSQCPPNQLLSEIKSTLMAGLQTEESVIPKTRMETAADTAPNNVDIESLLNANPETQRTTLAALYKKIQPNLDAALASEANSREELLGRALKTLLEDLFDHPEHITENSAQTLKKGIEGLHRTIPPENQSALNSEVALQSILQSLE